MVSGEGGSAWHTVDAVGCSTSTEPQFSAPPNRSMYICDVLADGFNEADTWYYDRPFSC